MGILNNKWMIVDDLECRTDMTENLLCFLNLSLRSNQELTLKKGLSLVKSKFYIYSYFLLIYNRNVYQEFIEKKY